MDKSKRYETIFAVVGLMFFAGVFGSGLSAYLSSQAISLIRYTVLGGSIVLLAQRWRNTLTTAFRGKWIWGLILLMTASFSWAIDPVWVITGVRGELIPMLCFSLYLGSRFSIRELFQIILWALGISMLLSVILVFARPDLGKHPFGPHVGSWKGVFDHKNTFSAYSVQAAAAFFMSATYAKDDQIKMWLLFAGCFAAIFLSTSVTGLVLSFVSIAVIIIYCNIRWVGIRSVLITNIALFLAGGGAAVILTAWNPIITGLGRDPTLTNRTLIWEFVINYKVPMSPIVGFGRGMFWQNSALYDGIESAAHHIPAHSHSGFVDLLLDAGLVGASFFIIAFFMTFAKTLRVSYLNRGIAAYQWPPVFLTIMLLSNYTESYLTRSTNIFWVLFVATVFLFNRKQPEEI